MQKSSRFPIRLPAGPMVLAAALAGAALAGCSHAPYNYSWSHQASGEYLFAFDTRECGEAARAISEAGRTALESPAFFACMRERGYFLVDAQTGEILVATSDDRLPPALSPQARR